MSAGVAWKVKRLRAMGTAEVAYRLLRVLQTHWEKSGVQWAKSEVPVGEGGRAWHAEAPGGLDESLYTSAADRVLSGMFKLFDVHEMELGFPPNWNRDPKTGVMVPLDFGKSIDYRDEARVGDIKYLWELNRHLELVTLGQAYHLSGSKVYVEGAQTLIESWLEQCPHPKGPNWTSSLEVALRLVNWAYAWHLLGGERSPLFEFRRGQEFKRVWLESVYRHLHFVQGHLSRYSSANNHLIGEYLGLFVGAVTWPLWSECQTWSAFAKSGMEKEALRQNGTDGVNREQAIWYEHAVADMMLHAGLVGRANGIEFSDQYWARLAAILEHVASMMDVSGRVPMFGDADDGTVARLSQEPDYDGYHSLLATGAVLFERGDFKAIARRFDDKSRWLLGAAAATEFESLSEKTDRLPVRREFADGGYWILGDRFGRSDEVRIVADAAPLGYLSIAAHGHADALSFVLSAHGREILVDPGTYALHTHKEWREYFRGTAAHNTLRVDGQDQSVPGGSFLWLKHARATCHHFESTPEFDEWEASHDGYLRLHNPVTHRRRLVFDKRTGIIAVTDTLEGSGAHAVELFWHFAEDCIVEREGSAFIVRHGDVGFKVSPPGELQASLVRGRESPPLGWVSRRYDQKVPTTTLVCDATLKCPTALHTRLEPVEAAVRYH